MHKNENRDLYLFSRVLSAKEAVIIYSLLHLKEAFRAALPIWERTTISL